MSQWPEPQTPPTESTEISAEIPAETPAATPVLQENAGGSSYMLGPSWQEQDPVLRDLWLANEPPQVIADKLGRSIPAIMTRAARLGLPRRAAPGRKPGIRNPETGEMRPPTPAVRRASSPASSPSGQEATTSLRVCLMCLRKFESLGRHNRICGPCKGSSEYESATSLPELHIPAS